MTKKEAFITLESLPFCEITYKKCVHQPPIFPVTDVCLGPFLGSTAEISACQKTGRCSGRCPHVCLCSSVGVAQQIHRHVAWVDAPTSNFLQFIVRNLYAVLYNVLLPFFSCKFLYKYQGIVDSVIGRMVNQCSLYIVKNSFLKGTVQPN
jgi:hypothetical protein